MSPWRWPNFTPDELRCQGTGLLRYDPLFLDRLQDLRVAFNRPMRVTSGCRAKAHNDKPATLNGAGGHLRSLHVGDVAQHPGQIGALAVDIATPNGSYRGDLFALAWRFGFSIGWNAKRGFLHLDLRTLVGLKQTSFDY